MSRVFDNTPHRDNVAILSETGDTVTYAQLLLSVKELEKIVHRRSLVFCLCRNEPGALIGYYSLIEAGSVPVLLDGTKDKEVFGQLLSVYEPNYIWTRTEECDPGWGEVVYEDNGYCLVAHSEHPVEMPDGLGLLLTTSGSTGSPKLVRLSYENIRSNAESIIEYLHITSAERPITSLPMYYSYGLSVINTHLIQGATILLTDRPVIQKEFWNFARQFKATSIAGVPYTYEMFKRLNIFGLDLPSLKTMTQAGGKLNAGLAEEYVQRSMEHNKRFFIMYGQTEATARMSYLPIERAPEKFAGIGIAIPGGNFKLLDENGKEITRPEVTGELVYTGKNVSWGYAESRRDLSLEDLNKGVLFTGDLAYRDRDGFYYIAGRKKRFVKIYGNRVNLDSLEQIVKQEILSCACVGEDDKITVFITDEQKKDAVKRAIIRKTGLNLRAFTIRHIESIPKNTSGKTRYSELLKLIG